MGLTTGPVDYFQNFVFEYLDSDIFMRYLLASIS